MTRRNLIAAERTNKRPQGATQREISDTSRSPGHNLAKVLNKLFELYTIQTNTAVNGVKQLIQFIRGSFWWKFIGQLWFYRFISKYACWQRPTATWRKNLEDDSQAWWNRSVHSLLNKWNVQMTTGLSSFKEVSRYT